jgi:hypothetical protein
VLGFETARRAGLRELSSDAKCDIPDRFKLILQGRRIDFRQGLWISSRDMPVDHVRCAHEAKLNDWAIGPDVLPFHRITWLPLIACLQGLAYKNAPFWIGSARARAPQDDDVTRSYQGAAEEAFPDGKIVAQNLTAMLHVKHCGSLIAGLRQPSLGKARGLKLENCRAAHTIILAPDNARANLSVARASI